MPLLHIAASYAINLIETVEKIIMQSSEMLYVLTNGFNVTDPMSQDDMIEIELDAVLMAEFKCDTPHELFDFLLSTKAIQLVDVDFWKSEQADYERDLY